MALDSENEEERAATWNSFPKVNLRREEATTDARKLPSQRNERGEKADSDKITNQFVVT